MSDGRNVIFVYDGSFEGLLTAIFDAYKEKLVPLEIISSQHVQQQLFAEYRNIVTDQNKSNRIWQSIKKNISPQAIKNIYYAFLSNCENKGRVCYDYVRACFFFGQNVNLHIACTAVNDMLNLCRHVKNQAHQYIEFVRFSELDNGVFYSEISPECDVLPLIASHFRKRLSGMPWIIHDLNRKQCIVYNGKELYISPTDVLPTIKYSENEQLYRQMWKDFYNHIEIKERHNEKCQNNHMPKKFRKYMTEFLS